MQKTVLAIHFQSLKRLVDKLPMIGKNLSLLLFFSVSAFAEDNTVTLVDGVNSNVYNMYVGQTGTNNVLQIFNGGSMTSYYAFVGYEATADDNHAIVSGAGSRWFAGQHLTVGCEGSDNSLTVESNAVVDSDNQVYVGEAGFASNNSIYIRSGGSLISRRELVLNVGTQSCDSVLLVSGNGSTLTVSNDQVNALQIGYRGQGASLVVSNGGLLQVPGFLVGVETGSSCNAVTITGTNTLLMMTNVLDNLFWREGEMIVIGRGGHANSFSLTDGAQLYMWPSNDWSSEGDFILGSMITASNNTALVSGAGSALYITNGLIVGSDGSHNTMTLENGGVLFTDGVVIGQKTNAMGNQVAITGSGTVWSNRYLYIGEEGGGSIVTVTNGGMLYVGNSGCTLGYGRESSNNQLRISGTGSTLRNRYAASVGNSGNRNRMILADGARYLGSRTMYVGRQGSSSENELFVSGAGTFLHCPSGGIVVGYSGIGNNFTISDEAAAECTYFRAGDIGDWNRVLLTGSGTVISNHGSLIVGNGGNNNSMLINSGAWMNADSVFIGDGGVDAGSNRLEVVGPAILAATNALYVGMYSPCNALILTNGATLSFADRIYFGMYEDADGNTMHLTGTGTVLSTSDHMYLGYESRENSVQVDEGACLEVHTLLMGSSSSQGGSNVLEIVGTGSTVQVTDYLSLAGAFSRVSVRDGARFSLDDTYGSSTGLTLELIGPNATWDNRNDFDVSGNDHSLLVSNGAMLQCRNSDIGSTGTGNIMRVTGTGTVFEIDSALRVGSWSGTDHQLFVEQGAHVADQDGYVGWMSNAWGSAVIVDGTGSCWSNRFRLGIGGLSASNQLLVLTNGGSAWAHIYKVGSEWGSKANRVLIYSDSTLTVTGLCTVFGGTNVLNGGTMYAARLVWTNEEGGFDFNSGWLSTKEAMVDVSEPFTVGNGTTPAIYELQSGSASGHTFASSLRINSSATLRGNGAVAAGVTEVLSGGTLQPGGTNQTATLTFDGLLLRNGAVYDYELGGGTDQIIVAGSLASDWHGVCTLKLHDLGGGWTQTNVFMRFTTNSTRMVWDVDRSDVPAATNIGVIQTGTEMALAPIQHHCVAKDGLHQPLYENWVKAATNIPAAVTEALGGIPIFVSNGVWHTGGGQVSGSTLVLDDVDIQSAPDASFVDICAGLTGSGNRFVIQNGAILSSFDFSISRMASANSNTTEVNGSSAMLSCDHLYVGREGTSASLVAANGGRVDDSVGYVGFATSAVKNVARITGAGSVMSNSSDLFVGYYGANNRLEVLDGGYIVCDEGFVGWDPPATNNEAVINAAVWECRILKVGRLGNGNALTITNGGMAFSQSGYVGETGATGNTVYVTGSGSTWSNTLALFVGDGGAGSRLEIHGGGFVYAPTISVGGAGNSQDSSIALGGINTKLAAGSLVVGGSGSGNRLWAMPDAEVDVADLLLGQTASAADSRLTLEPYSKCTVANTCEIRYGTNELNHGGMTMASLLMTNNAGIFEFNSGSVTAQQVSVDNGQPFTVGAGSMDSRLVVIGQNDFCDGLVLNPLGVFEYEGVVGAPYVKLAGGGLDPAGTNAGSLSVTNLVVENGAHYYFDARSATQDLIEVVGALTNDSYPTVTIHVRNLGGADWTTDRTILSYGSVTGDIDWVVDLGDSGAEQLTVVHEPAHNIYVLKEPAIYYVAPGGSDTFPYDRWDRAAHDPQTPADLSGSGDYIYISNGVYNTGGRVSPAGGMLTNRLCITNAVQVIAVNGPDVTTIQGSADPVSTNGFAATRCVYLAAGATLRGFTLADGHTCDSGDDVYDLDGGGGLLAGNATVWDCIIRDCTASDDGGGVRGMGSTKLRDTVVIHNSSGDDGGGVYGCSIYESTVTGNTAGDSAGGLHSGKGVNSIVYGNNGAGLFSNFVSATFSYSCTAPLAAGSGNTAKDPLLSDVTGGDVCPRPESPCINSGSNGDLLGTNDITGFQRVFAGTCDMGAYETYQPLMVITNPIDGQTNSYDFDIYTFEGRFNPNTTRVTWSNSFNGVSDTVFWLPSWSWSIDIPLAVGTNEVLVSGRNSLGNESSDTVTIIRGGVGSGTPIVHITEPVGSTAPVAYDVTSYAVSGTNNMHIIGTMWVSNAGNGEVYSYAAASNWIAPSVFLVEGTNTVSVWGTNLWEQTGIDIVDIVRQHKQGGDSNVVYHVATDGRHLPPFVTWATAATQIQSAVELTYDGDMVLVSNGVYDSGGAVPSGGRLTNRVLVTAAIHMRSMNGYSNTYIVGAANSGTMDGPGAVRCLWLGAAAHLDGFTLMDGHTLSNIAAGIEGVSGGGVYFDALGTLSNIQVRNCSAMLGGAALMYGGGVITHSELRENVASNTGGVLLYGGGLVENSVIVSNIGPWGGGVYFTGGGVLNRCTVEGNYTPNKGGGIYHSDVGVVSNCIVRNNHSGSSGGGIYTEDGGCIVNTLIAGNSADVFAGGVYCGKTTTVINCTIVDNVASVFVGGCFASLSNEIFNSVVYFNTAPDDPNSNTDELSTTYGYVCTPNALPGMGNITDDPQFVDLAGENFHLYSDSPCVNSGNNAYADGSYDLDNKARILETIVDIGCYELLRPAVDITNNDVAVYGITERYTIGGTSDVNVIGTMWWTNDEAAVGGAFTVPGLQFSIAGIDLSIGTNTITAYGSNSYGGVGRDSVAIERLFEYGGNSPIHYVQPSGGDVYPYTNWAMAAAIMQDAVDAASSNDTVLATNGVYDQGGRVTPGFGLTNRVTIEKAIVVESINGPSNTFIAGASDGGGNGPAAVRCVFLAAGASLDGFTLTNGHTWASGGTWQYDHSGGGLWLTNGTTVKNCIVWGGGAATAGGAFLFQGGTLADSRIVGNTTPNEGGGVRCENGGTVRDCLIEENAAEDGGAIYLKDGTPLIERCVIRGNECAVGSADGGGIWLQSGGTIRNCLITENTATNTAGGVFFGSEASNAVLEGCTIVSNHAEIGGGVRMWNGGIRNCIIYDNTVWGEATNWSWGGNNPVIEYTCTTPTNGIPGGEGCITNAPQFVMGGDYRPNAASPSIDAGTNVTGMVDDLDGIPRPLDGNADGTSTVDMGAYEYVNASADSDGDTMLDQWELDYRLSPTNAADALTDNDGDAFINEDEFTADTDPRNSNSYFHVTGIDESASQVISFVCTNSRMYSLHATTNLVDGEWLAIDGATNVTGVGESMSLTDSVDAVQRSYRVGVSLP